MPPACWLHTHMPLNTRHASRYCMLLQAATQFLIDVWSTLNLGTQSARVVFYMLQSNILRLINICNGICKKSMSNCNTLNNMESCTALHTVFAQSPVVNTNCAHSSCTATCDSGTLSLSGTTSSASQFCTLNLLASIVYKSSQAECCNNIHALSCLHIT